MKKLLIIALIAIFANYVNGDTLYCFKNVRGGLYEFKQNHPAHDVPRFMYQQVQLGNCSTVPDGYKNVRINF